jgi:hypothetical protein
MASGKGKGLGPKGIRNWQTSYKAANDPTNPMHPMYKTTLFNNDYRKQVTDTPLTPDGSMIKQMALKQQANLVGSLIDRMVPKVPEFKPVVIPFQTFQRPTPAAPVPSATTQNTGAAGADSILAANKTNDNVLGL